MSILLLSACGSSAGSGVNTGNKTQPLASGNAKATAKSEHGTKILVAYFSRTGENYEVGDIAKGNTHIVADMIAGATGADMFEIKTVTPYPENYRECTEVAKKEYEANARPALSGRVANMKDYDVIFLGYPIWWSDLPMPVYTFLESYDWNGKTIIPFCTSAGDVLTGKESDIPKFAKGATLRDGIGIRGKRAQETPERVRPEVEKWLTGLGLMK